MRNIDKAYCSHDTKKSIMSFNDITEDENFETIKDFLICPTKGCHARLTYARGDNSHLRTYRGDEHAEDCEYAFNRIQKEKRLEKEGEISTLLTEKDFMKRHKYLLNKVLSSSLETKNTTKKKKKTSSIQDNLEKTSPYIKGNLSSNNVGETLEEIKKSGQRVIGPRIPSKSLNQIGIEDLNTKCETLAQIYKIKKVRNKIYEIHGKWKNFEVIFTLPESFFANQYIETENYVNILRNFLDLNSKYEVYLCTCCEVKDVKDKILHLSILNHNWPALMISKDSNKTITLSQFVAYYTRKHYA